MNIIYSFLRTNSGLGRKMIEDTWESLERGENQVQSLVNLDRCNIDKKNEFSDSSNGIHNQIN